jgi:peptidylprolyl isomerase
VFKTKDRKAFAGTVIAISFATTILLTSCTTDGGIKTAGVSQATPQPIANSEYISVTGKIGEQPALTAPKGNPPSSLVVRDITTGTGAVATATSKLTLHYTLMSWSNGKVLGSSYSAGKPSTFLLSNVIPGWQQGVPGMKAGGRRLLIIPPALAYGANGAGPIAPNETLIFVVDLIAVA